MTDGEEARLKAMARTSTRTSRSPKADEAAPGPTPRRRTARKPALVPTADPQEQPGGLRLSFLIDLGFLIHDVSRLRRTAFDRLMRSLGVTRSQWWVLAYLSRSDGMTQTQLANILDLGKVALGGLIDRLEAGGWVLRRADSVDRRVRRIFLAPRTVDLFKGMHAAEAELGAKLLDGIGQQRAQELYDMLARMKQNLIAFGAVVGQNGESEADADD
jgi:MarR family transcriptional regulator, transcriptional regulator for hemolysin